MRCRPALLLILLAACLALLCAGPAYGESGDDANPKAKSEPKPAPPADPKAPRPRAPKPAPQKPTGPPRDGSLRKLGARLEALAARIGKVIEDARRDPDEALIAIYLKYSPKELKTRKRQVRAEHLVAIMVDPKNSMELRDKARTVLNGGTLRGDIELSSTSKRRGVTERAYFCRTKVVGFLKHADRDARRFTHLLLKSWYRVNTVPAILGYKYDDKKSWGRAITAWNKELRK